MLPIVIMAAVPARATKEDGVGSEAPTWSVVCIADIMSARDTRAMSEHVIKHIQTATTDGPVPLFSHVHSPDGGTGFAICSCTSRAAVSILPRTHDMPSSWERDITLNLEYNLHRIELDVGDLVCLAVRSEWFKDDVLGARPEPKKLPGVKKTMAACAGAVVHTLKAIGGGGAVSVFSEEHPLVIPLLLFHGRLSKQTYALFDLSEAAPRVRTGVYGCFDQRVLRHDRIWACSLRAPVLAPSGVSIDGKKACM